MERPTCGTCVYFVCFSCLETPSDDTGCSKDAEGKPVHDTPVCTRYPKQFVQHGEDLEGYHWPEMKPWETCGEHQDFPAYVASLKEKKATWTCQRCGFTTRSATEARHHSMFVHGDRDNPELEVNPSPDPRLEDPRRLR